MPKKNNIRSIRMSDELMELIDQQIGENFTQKLETLVTKCVWELPRKEQQLQLIQDQIDREGRRLQDLSNKTYQLTIALDGMTRQAKVLESNIQATIKKMES